MLQIARDAIDSDHVKIPWDQFSEWLHCVCVVTFDLELGQALEVRNISFNHSPKRTKW